MIEIKNYKIEFDEKEILLLNKLGFYKIENDDDLDKLEDEVADYLSLYCFDENYEPNQDGLICESILDKLSELE